MFSLAFFLIGSIAVSFPSGNVRLFLFVTWCNATVEYVTVATLRHRNMACPTTELFDISTTNEEIVTLCQDVRFSLGGESGYHVTRIAQNAVVKWGANVSVDEASIQDFVQEHANACILKVPEVFRFFQIPHGYRQYGYLVMEYVKGQHMDEVLQKEMLPTLCSAISHLWSIPVPFNHRPGPFCGGQPRGYVWSDNGPPRSFRTLAELEAFINWCANPTERFTFTGSPPVICHMDLAARNILRLTDGRVCILDWEFACIYPRCFEIYSLVARSSWEPYCEAVLRELGYPGKRF
jgi:Phosphotransferase enzyme family